MKRFNTTGTCYPYKHYMVNIDERVQQIKKMVDRGDYFCINRGRQYGKTTTLEALNTALSDEYCVFFISFEDADDEAFSSIKNVGYKIFHLFKRLVKYNSVKGLSEEAKQFLMQDFSFDFGSDDISDAISDFCAICPRPVVLMIDEVDQAGNYDAFINLLRILRNKYLAREKLPTFHSVILAGVYDVKNLKLKVRPDDEHQYNSPWNIAAQFDVSMELSKPGISGMLCEYEQDHHTGMDIEKMSALLFDYTSGYPFLVSRLCQIIDEDLKQNWTNEGFLEALKILLAESNTLFDDMRKKLDDFGEMRNVIFANLYNGELFAYNSYDRAINIAKMFNFVKDKNGKVALANRIFEIWFYNLFESEAEKAGLKDSDLIRNGSMDKPLFIKNGHLDMKTVLERFCVHFNEIYDNKDEQFIEKQGRKFFLFFLKPIINGTGNYYVEAETRDERRMDVVVDYNGERFVIELKIWHGESYNERGEKQLTEFLDYYGLNEGYLLSFCFNKEKKLGVKEIVVKTENGNKKIVEAVV